MLKIKRVYTKYEITDGITILVDRLWPRGVRKTTLNAEIWMSEIAPSDSLRKWYAHDPKKWARFKERYITELKENPLVYELIRIIRENPIVTLVYAASDTKHNNAVVLRGFMGRRVRGPAAHKA